jgi:hypothetical protein
MVHQILSGMCFSSLHQYNKVIPTWNSYQGFKFQKYERYWSCLAKMIQYQANFFVVTNI